MRAAVRSFGLPRRSSASSALLALTVATTLLLGGCASTPPQVSALESQWPARLPPRADLSSRTPFIAQDDYECGPAALAMLLRSAGRPATIEQLKPQVFLPGRKGSLQTEMLVATRRQGLPAYVLPPRLDALLTEVAAGHPVVVFQNLSLDIAPVWHYAVAVGYDRERRTILLHSGTTERQEVELAVFERTWARGEHWAMTTMPLDQLPASLDGAQAGAALAALERLNAPAARKGYASALTRWPGEPVLLMGAGNTAYAAKDRRAAVKAYARLTDVRPDIPDGWNNLAQVLMEQGMRYKASLAIERAVALGGPRLDQYKALQKKITGM
ncbi:MAG: PA2778 family cysteine peptidase [Mitsuaria chitosanitabida]|uniref:PA2778 family cysteine peptidase n=1 Tax=Roseateles chitosanitabidus TaxID=65048 RepID=UPI001B230ACC|nr:PA2778 family cysteine peptidase [Roseateles chitosanitabidus]MBO9685521.1 PA2778 family cysteine peptidase [Roseateles chitosanitabidus]